MSMSLNITTVEELEQYLLDNYKIELDDFDNKYILKEDIDFDDLEMNSDNLSSLIRYVDINYDIDLNWAEDYVNKDKIDLDDIDDDIIISHVDRKYNVDLTSKNEIYDTQTIYTFACNNLSDESLMDDVIEKNDIGRLLV